MATKSSSNFVTEYGHDTSTDLFQVGNFTKLFQGGCILQAS